MAHGIDVRNGKATMAYVGDTPWHGLGQQLSAGATIEQWAEEAGLNYTIQNGQLKYTYNGAARTVPAKRALYRSDDGELLGVVGTGYKIVQPKEVLSFFKDFAEEHEFVLETAGVLFGGKKYWALAKTPLEFSMGKDKVCAYLLLATACDGSMSTIAKYTSVRTVCNNTIELAMADNKGTSVRTRHNSVFKEKDVKLELGILTNSWEQMSKTIMKLSKRHVDLDEATAFLKRVMGDPTKPEDKQPNKQNIERILTGYSTHTDIGGELKSAKETAWGLCNSCSEWVDWQRGNGADRRIEWALLGQGAMLKARVFQEAEKTFL